MNYKNLKRANVAGFTLVELLVVIAIIGILASIVVPNMTRYMGKARVAKAVSEITNADIALTAMLADGNKARFRDFLTTQGRTGLQEIANSIAFHQANGNTQSLLEAIGVAQAFYNEFFYDLLRNGSNADFGFINPNVRSKLEDGYMQLAQDPWGAQYRFWMGPQPLRTGPIYFRSYRIPRPLDNFPLTRLTFYWTEGNRNFYSSELPGQPRWDDLPGYPADRTKTVYIYSTGPNQLVDAFITIGQIYNEPDWLGGGDDINNWDSQQGWNDAPK